MNNTTYRPYNSVRFICPCGRRQTFPRSPDRKNKDKDITHTFPDGTTKSVDRYYKTVVCSCGHATFKQRLGFNGR